ncbi:hypothetical protein C8R44DRAFT_166673 [Mycena epipterygia]|nr:hypothetical protein C8R44DRAFT_166673 [Mycena epipterygia]
MLIGWAWGEPPAWPPPLRPRQNPPCRAPRRRAAEPRPRYTTRAPAPIPHLLRRLPRRARLGRVSATLFIGTFAMGALRSRVPKLALMGIFGTIVMNVFCSKHDRKDVSDPDDMLRRDSVRVARADLSGEFESYVVDDTRLHVLEVRARLPLTAIHRAKLST